MKEFAFMTVLYDHGFPVPRPIDQNRHCILMELCDATPLYQIRNLKNPGALYNDLMNLIVRFAKSGLIHGDFNEFNLLIAFEDEGDETSPEVCRPIVIDFPQMVSTSHMNAEMYFDRDIQCIRTFFQKRFHYVSNLYPTFAKTILEKGEGLDVLVEASGFSRNLDEQLLAFQRQQEEQEQEEDGEEESEESESEPEILVREIDSLDIKQEPSSDAEEEDSGSELEEFDNHQHKPFRDAKSGATRAAPKPKPKAARVQLTPEEIKKRVQKSKKQTHSVKASKQNRVKSGAARTGRDSLKFNGDWE